MKKIAFLAAALIMGSTHSAWAFNYPEYIVFESTNHCSGCDLSNAQITPNHSRAKLSNANLSNIKTMFGAANLSQADLTNTNMSAVELPGANFTEADFSGANLVNAHVENSNFTGAKGLNLTNAYACGSTLPDGEKLPPC